jgi:transposase
MFDHIDNKIGPGRVEIRTGIGRRRRWSDEEKARIVAEALAPGAVKSEVARRYNILPQHLFTWIYAAKRGRLTLPVEEAGDFIPVITDGPVRCGRETAGVVEMAVGGVQVRVHNGADAPTIEAVLRAIRHAGMGAC